MTKFLIHFPVFLALFMCFLFFKLGINYSYWLFVPAWQALCAGIILMGDGKNREKRYRKILHLVLGGRDLNSLPREKTLCGFFIRAAVLWQIKPDQVRLK